MSSSSFVQTCSCPCGASSFETTAPPVLRFFCHCQICQKLYQQPFADATVLRLSDVVLPQSHKIQFNKYRKFVGIERGLCAECNKPVLAITGSGSKGLAFVAAQNFSNKDVLPEPEMHIFYGSRAADIADELPKYKGYVMSQIAVLRSLFSGGSSAAVK